MSGFATQLSLFESLVPPRALALAPSTVEDEEPSAHDGDDRTAELFEESFPTITLRAA